MAKEHSKKREKQIVKAVKAGKRPRTRKTWYTVHFRKPTQQVNSKNPQYPRKALDKRRALDKFQVLRYPVGSDKVMRTIDDENINTVVFITDIRATKKKIAQSFSEMYNCKVDKVRTLITSKGQKKAYISLPADVQALNIASQIGLLS